MDYGTKVDSWAGLARPQLKRDSLGSDMIYGTLNLRDRLIRAAIGAIIGGSVGFVLMLREDLWGLFLMHARSSFLLPMMLLGAVIGGLLAFRRKKI